MRGLTEEQRAERAKGIGGSDAGRIMAGEWRQLWLEKTGRAQPEDLSWVIPVQIGHCTEQFNAEYFEHVTGRAVTSRGVHIVSKKYPWMRANLDGVTTTQQGQMAYWDAKHVGLGRSGEKMVLRYTPQMTHCCVILNLEHWVLSVLVGNNKHEIIEQETDPFYIEELIEKEREFWSYIEKDEEPRDREEPTAAPKPQKLFRNIDLSAEFGSPEWKDLIKRHQWAVEFCNAAEKFRSTEGAAKVHAMAREEMKALAPEDAGEIRRGDVLLTRNRAGAITIKREAK